VSRTESARGWFRCRRRSSPAGRWQRVRELPGNHNRLAGRDLRHGMRQVPGRWDADKRQIILAREAMQKSVEAPILYAFTEPNETPSFSFSSRSQASVRGKRGDGRCGPVTQPRRILPRRRKDPRRPRPSRHPQGLRLRRSDRRHRGLLRPRRVRTP